MTAELFTLRFSELLEGRPILDGETRDQKARRAISFLQAAFDQAGEWDCEPWAA